MNLKPYNSPTVDTSILKNVPMQYLKQALAQLRSKGMKVRVMYHGPRRTEPNDTRSDYSKQSGCLKAYATRFSVYIDTRTNQSAIRYASYFSPERDVR